MRVALGAGECVMPVAQACENDDVPDANDGPSVASPLSVGATVNARSCTGIAEEDWYRITLSAPSGIRVSVTWSPPDAHFDTLVHDASGERLSLYAGAVAGPSSKELYEDLPAGDYFVVVDPNTFGLDDPFEAVPYALTVTTCEGVTCQPAPASP